MNTRTRILVCGIASLLSAATLRGQTWDGGGADNNFGTANNWNPNGVPANNGTANLVFGGAARLTPLVNVNFDIVGLTFDNSASPFIIGASGGSTLTVRGGGITNNDADLQSLSTPITFAAGSSITAASGSIDLSGALALGTNTVTVGGSSNVNMDAITGTGTLVKNGSGTLSIAPSGTQTYGLTINAGTVATTGSITHSGSTISVAGGTYAPGVNLTLSSASVLNVAAGGTFTFPSSRTLTVQGGSSATFSGGFTSSLSSVIIVSGASSTMSTAGTTIRDGAEVRIGAGGTFTATSGSFTVGSVGTSGSFLIDGAGATLASSGVSTVQVGISPGAVSSLTFRNGATGSFPSATLRFGTLAGAIGRLEVRDGTQVTTGTVELGASANSGTASMLITGANSKVIATFNIADFAIGGATGEPCTATIADGGTLQLAGPLTIGETGTLNLDGGFLTMAQPVAAETIVNRGKFNWTAGRVTLGFSLNVGGGDSPLGTNLVLTTGKELSMASNASLTLGPAASLVIDGGKLNVGTLVNSGGVLDFRRGSLSLTNSAGVSIGGSGPLGSAVTVPLGSALTISGTTTVSGAGTLEVSGGTLTLATLQNSANVRIESGVATVNSATNASGGQLFIGRTFTVNNTLTNSAGGRIELGGGSARLFTIGALQNNGLLTGSGTIAGAATNGATGEVRVDAGQTIFVIGAFAPNAGELTLQGGTLDFSTPITNGATGFISGRGAIRSPGLTNSGVMAFSGGTADLRGDVTVAAGGRIATSGAGSVTTFFDDVAHNGQEIFTGAGASTVIFGAQSGAGAFTGTGTVYSNGDLRPGNSTASVLFQGNLVLGEFASLTMEIGGLLRGTQHDHLTINGTFDTAGLLKLELVNGFEPSPGDQFDLFDTASFNGGFTTIDAPALPNGATWDFSDLMTTGVIVVVPESGATILTLLGGGLLGFRRRRKDEGRWTN